MCKGVVKTWQRAGSWTHRVRRRRESGAESVNCGGRDRIEIRRCSQKCARLGHSRNLLHLLALAHLCHCALHHSTVSESIRQVMCKRVQQSATDTSLPQSIIASLPRADTDVIQSPNTEAWSDQSQHSHIDTFPAHAYPVRFRLEIHFKVSKGILMKTVDANEGDDILSIAHEYDIDWYVSFCHPGHPPCPLFLPRW